MINEISLAKIGFMKDGFMFKKQDLYLCYSNEWILKTNNKLFNHSEFIAKGFTDINQLLKYAKTNH